MAALRIRKFARYEDHEGFREIIWFVIIHR
jgi:hypothetical protein